MTGLPVGGEPTIEWILGDMLQVLMTEKHREAYHLVFDCQVFHVMRAVNEEAFAALVVHLLAPGGVYATVAGNAYEEGRNPGPPVLTVSEMVAPFEAAGLQLLQLRSTRFAATPAYGKHPPLAWLGVFGKPTSIEDSSSSDSPWAVFRGEAGLA
jgi:hypothetical protein